MDSALGLAIILATSVNVAGVVVFWRYLRDYWTLLTRPRVVIHGGNAAPGTPQGCVVDVDSLRSMLASGALGGGLHFPPHPIVPRKTAIFDDAAIWARRERQHRNELRWADEVAYQRGLDRFRRYPLLESFHTETLRRLVAPARAPFQPQGTLTGRTMNRASTLERRTGTNSIDTRKFYVLKTKRGVVAPQGRFIAMTGDDEMSVLPNIGQPQDIVAKAAQFPSISAVLVAVDSGYGLDDREIAGLRICRVTATEEPAKRTVAPVTMAEAKTAKLVVRLVGDRIRNHDLYRQGDRMQYGSLDTAQVFNGLADLQRRAPQTYTNPDREVLAVTLTPGRTRYEEVEVG